MSYAYRIIGYKKVSFIGKDNKLIEGYRFYFAKCYSSQNTNFNGFVEPFDKFVFSNREELLASLFTFYSSHSLVYLLYNERGTFIDVKEADIN